MIGQPIEIYGWFPTVSFGCKCRAAEGGPPVSMLIAGMDSTGKCSACGANYRIGAIQMDAQKKEGTVSIMRVVPKGTPA